MGATGFVRRWIVGGCVVILLGAGGSLWQALGQEATMPATTQRTSLANMTPQQRRDALRARQAELQKRRNEGNEQRKALILEKRLSGNADGVLAVRFSPDGKMLASGGADNTVRVWDVATGKELKKLEGHKRQVWTVAFSWDGKYVLSGGLDQQIIAWNVETGEIEGMWPQTDYVMHLAFVSKDNYFVSADGEDLVMYKIGQDAAVQQMHADGTIRSLVSTNDGGAVTGDDAGSLILWDTSTWQRMQVHKRPKGDQDQQNIVCGLCRLQNGEILVADEERLWRWNLQSGEIVPVNGMPSHEMTTVDSDQVVVSGLTRLAMLTWLGEQRSWPIMGTENAYSVSSSPSGDLFAVAWGGAYDAVNRYVHVGPTDVEIYNTAKTLAQEQTDAGARARNNALAALQKIAATRPGIKVPGITTTQPAPPPPKNPWQ